MKILFKIIDYIISVLMGTGTLYLVSLVVSEGWNMFFAMIVGMVITMFIGMSAGMVITTGKADFQFMLIASIFLSIIIQLCIDLYNIRLKGEVPVEN